MDTNQERYFFLSGIISISLFAVLVLLAGYTLLVPPQIDSYAMTQSEIVNISIAIAEPTEEKEAVVQESSEVSEATPEEEAEMTREEPVPEISDLFSQVKVDKTPKKREEEHKRRDELNNLEKELLQTKEHSSFLEKVNKVELAKPSVKMVPQGGSTGPLVNEYHAKIQGLVYTYFRPPSGSVGEMARIRMKLSASGRLVEYKILRFSKNGPFNHEVEWLKDRLSTVRFPEHPEGRDAVLEFILTAKE